MKHGTLSILGHIVRRETTRSEFLEWKLGAELYGNNPPYAMYKLVAIPIRNREMIVTLDFRDERLLNLALTDPKDYEPPQETHLSGMALEDAKDRNDQWLAQEFGIDGGRCDFAGGRVESIADAKTGEATVYITYFEPSGA